MHLTGGQYKGRHISIPTGYETPVKPTLSKVRESVFNILNSYFLSLEGVSDKDSGNVFGGFSFLDMFAGSGIMALEAYSRGFKDVVAIEKDYKTFCAVKKLYKDFNAEIAAIKGDATKLINNLEMYDVIYIDPPWKFDYTPIVEAALKKLKKNGVAVVEYDNKNRENPLYQLNDEVILPFKEKIYGRCKLDFIKLS